MDNQIGRLENVDISDEAKKAYLDYAMSVIVARALPDVKDGLKPVHRRILFAMYEMGLYPTAKYAKSAKIVGETMGKYHPHGDMAIYDTLVRLAQDFAMRYPLVDGQGNFGSMDGDSAAAMRYCVTGDTLVVTNRGLVPIKEISNGSEDIDISVLSQHREINQASKWFDSGIHKSIKVTTNHGLTLEGSINHPILTWTKDAITGKPLFKWKLLNQITTDDIAVIDRTRDTLWPHKEISLEKFKPKIRYARIQIKILPKKLTQDLAFILGSLIAEGSITEKKIEFCNSDREWIKSFEKAWSRVFPDCRLHKFDRKPSSYGKLSYQRLEVHSLFVTEFLRNIGLGPQKSKNKIIPETILRSPKNVTAAFLQAYFEGDGSISSSKKMIELSCISISEVLLKQVQILLLRFGIVSAKRFDKYRNTHKLYIRGLKNYKLFKTEIDFVSDRKTRKLDEILSYTYKDQSIMDYVPYLKDFILASIDQNLAYTNTREFVYKHNFDRYTNMSWYENEVSGVILPTLKRETEQLLKALIVNNYLFDKIVKVERGKPERVYSLRVDSDSHSFIANGFINHNTEAKLTSLAMEMLFDIDKGTVEYNPNFDGTLKEPQYLPAKLPNLLLMGSEGIAVGMATKIPPHNLGEVIDAVNYTIKKMTFSKRPDVVARREDQVLTDEEINSLKPAFALLSAVTVDELLEYIKGPDFPTGGAIYDINEIKNVYRTGRGRILIRGIAEIEDIGQGKNAIIIREIPYQVNKSALVAKIAELAKDKKLDGITDLRDESDRHGIRVVVELKRDTSPRKVLNNLFKLTPLQTTFPANVVALVDGIPRTLNLKVLIDEYVNHRFTVITRRSEFELRQAKARIHILDGLLIAVNNIDEVIDTIKKSKDVEDARENLMKKFKLTEIQSVAILDMQLRRLAALEREKLQDEWEMVKETIDYLVSLLADPKKMLSVVESELAKIKEKYEDPRRTKVYKSKVDEFSEEDLIQNEPTVITLTQTGYIKRQSMTSFRTQARGGKGIRGMTTKEEDIIDKILYAETHDFILFFTNLGKVYQTRVFEMEEASRISKGTAIVNLIDITQGEIVQSILTYNPKEKEKSKNIVMATKKGVIKKTKTAEFANIRRGGIIAIKLDSDDSLQWVNSSSGEDDVVMITQSGKIINFPESHVRATGRASQGVRGIRLTKDDLVVGMDVVSKNDKEAKLLVVAENGLGKRTRVSEVRNQRRGGQGVRIANINAKTGKIVFAGVLEPDATEVIITSEMGQVVKIPLASTPLLSRNAQGVILMRFSDKNDRVAAATTVSP